MLFPPTLLSSQQSFDMKTRYFFSAGKYSPIISFFHGFPQFPLFSFVFWGHGAQCLSQVPAPPQPQECPLTPSGANTDAARCSGLGGEGVSRWHSSCKAVREVTLRDTPEPSGFAGPYLRSSPSCPSLMCILILFCLSEILPNV